MIKGAARTVYLKVVSTNYVVGRSGPKMPWLIFCPSPPLLSAWSSNSEICRLIQADVSFSLESQRHRVRMEVCERDQMWREPNFNMLLHLWTFRPEFFFLLMSPACSGGQATTTGSFWLYKGKIFSVVFVCVCVCVCICVRVYVCVFVWMCVCVCLFQTIVSAMSTLTPPMPLGNPGNQFRVDYIKSIAPLSDFEYTEVTHTRTHTNTHTHTHTQVQYVCGVMSLRQTNWNLSADHLQIIIYLLHTNKTTNHF